MCALRPRRATGLLFERDENSLVFDLADVSTVVLSGVRSVSPDIARRVPDDVDARLVDVREREFAGGTLAAADTVRRLAVWLPVAGAAAAGGRAGGGRRPAPRAHPLRPGAGHDGHRRRGGACPPGAPCWSDSIEGSDEIPRADLQAAVGGVWDSFLGDLRSLILIVALVGFVLASSILTVADPKAVRARLAALTRRPARTPLAAVRGVGAGGPGRPGAVAAPGGTARRGVRGRGGAGVPGQLGAAAGAGQLAAGRAAPGRVRRIAAVAGVAAVTAVVASMAAAFVLERGEQPAAVASSPGAGCNGMRELCGRRVNDVLFPGTHNAMSAADVPGWALANQRRSIPRQLDDGIRLFLLDPHYGRRAGGGRVLTDFAGEGRDRNKVARELDPPALAASGAWDRRSPGAGRGPRDVWLCHTLCELGATRFTETLTDMRRFLDREPPNVVVLFLENYVTDEDMVAAFRKTGHQDMALALDRGEPLPTLGEMIRQGKRLLVFTENRAEGVPWLNYGFEWVQDTPLKAQRPRDLNCRPSRGTGDSPILMLNHWIDRFPPPLSGNRRILDEGFLTRQIRRCERERRDAGVVRGGGLLRPGRPGGRRAADQPRALGGTKKRAGGVTRATR